MSIISVLDPFVSNQIAAGEVVERPASVVKELVENSLDAHATAITIEITDGGTSMIRVSDNGIGMDASDAETAFLRHATSKIHESTDLLSIETLGFRGEALAAISSVSKVNMWTRQAEASYGTKVYLEGGEVLTTEPFGAPKGTSITVSDLFFNTPARQKFLKKPFIEAGYVQEVVLRNILTRPDVSFRFISDKKQVFFSSGDGSLENAIYCVYGKTVKDNMKYIEGSFSNGTYSGFIGDVSLVRSNRKREHISINGRTVNCPSISFAIEESYNTLLMLHKFPFFTIQIKMDPHYIDVNVHPSKLEVRIQNETEITQAITSSCVKVLSVQNNPFADYYQKNSSIIDSFEITQKDKPTQKNIFTQPQQAKYKEDTSAKQYSTYVKSSNYVSNSNSFPVKNNSSGFSSSVKESIAPTFQKDSVKIQMSTPSIENKEEDKLLDATEIVKPYRYIGVFNNTYLLVEIEKDLYLIDQHAAHERILFEKFSKQIKNNTIVSQPLLIPYTESLSADEMNCFESNIEIIESIGFDAEVYGTNAVSIRSVPMILGEAKLADFLHESLDYLAEHKTNIDQTDIIRLEIATKACKAAIKAGDPLTNEEIITLLTLIENYDGPLTCPHGRPIYYVISNYQLEKWFKRIV